MSAIQVLSGICILGGYFQATKYTLVIFIDYIDFLKFNKALSSLFLIDWFSKGSNILMVKYVRWNILPR